MKKTPPGMRLEQVGRETAMGRESRRKQGFKEVRLWVPDPDREGFDEELVRQVISLRDTPEEAEAVAFAEEAADWSE